MKKFRERYKGIKSGINLLIVWSLVLLLSIQLNGLTNASFNDIENVVGSFSVCNDFDGTDDDCNPLPQPPDEWDKSSLKIDKENPIGSCTQEGYVFTFYYFNSGEDMDYSLWEWELYQVEKQGGGQAMKPIGERLDNGTLLNVKKNESGSQTTQINQINTGHYAFKVWRPSGHGNGESGGENQEDGRSFMWTEKIEVKEECNVNPKPLGSNKPDSTAESEKEVNKENDDQTDALNENENTDVDPSNEQSDVEADSITDSNDDEQTDEVTNTETTDSNLENANQDSQENTDQE